MRYFLRFGFVLLFIFWGFDGVGQRKCGTESPTFEQTQIMLKSITDFEKNILPNKKQSRIQSISVPVKFHALYDGYGNGGNLNSSITNIITKLNFWYANSGISFYPLVGINAISSQEYYYCNLDDTYDDRKALMDNYGYTNALNIFFIGRFVTTNPSEDESRVTGIAYFPLPSTYKTTDDITSIYSSKSSNGLFILSDFTYFTDKTYTQNIDYQVESTIPHEMGHYWGLLHTFSTTAGAEYVNGTNGSTTGDLVQDTPADNVNLVQYLRKNSSGSCYLASNNVRDYPNNQQYFPQLDNMMSYYNGCGGRITGGQATRTLWGQYVRNRLNPDLSQRYYLDGVSRTILQYSGSALLCAGNSINLTLNSYGAPSYYQGNFYVQIKPVNDYAYSAYISAGVYTSTGEVNITGTIPSNTTAGYYKIRICKATLAPLSDFEERTIYINGITNGIPTGSPIASQYALATTTLYNATSTCSGNSIQISSDVYGYDSYWWTKDGQNLTASSTNNYLNATTTGTYTLKMMKCGNVYTSPNSVYLRFYDPSPPTLTASIAGGISSNSMLNICDGTNVVLSTNCQANDNPIWDNGTTTLTRSVYVNASSTANFSVKCSNYFCTTANAPPVRIINQPFIQSTKSGNWQDPTMWTNNFVPLNCQTVTIQAGHTVNVPINDAKAKNIIIRGRLNFQNVSPTVKGKVGLGI